jgi:hypothetical protein
LAEFSCVAMGADLGRDLAGTALALARRFAAGATMWCLAPASPEHAHHVAVEFVHPVIMGKRALPAVSVGGPDPVAALRSSVRAGDILLIVATADDSDANAAVRRAPTWGAFTVWIGSGSRPPAGAADRVLWLEDPAGSAPFDGQLVLLYHVLWELTHVCFEHPGLLRDDASSDDCGEVVCVTCSDEGRRAEVLAVLDGGLASVRSARGVEAVDTTMVERPRPGDLVVVHAGTVIAVLAGGSS